MKPFNDLYIGMMIALITIGGVGLASPSAYAFESGVFTKAPAFSKTLVQCTDHDGDDEYTKGNVRADIPSDAGYTTYWDECISLDEVKEWVCEDGRAVGLSIGCDFGCDDGACALPPWVEEQKLGGSSRWWDGEFAHSVALSGDTALIGASKHEQLGDEAGAAYVFTSNSGEWTEEQVFLASDGAAYDYFGTSVSLSGDVAVIGAPSHDSGTGPTGAVYVFRKGANEWVFEQKLVASDGEAQDNFGVSVAVWGDVIVVGAHLNDEPGQDNSGAAYVYRYNGATWVEEQKLVAPDAESSDKFGLAVSVYGDTAVIGTPFDDDSGNNAGSAYIFSYDGYEWVFEQKLLASDGDEYDYFGGSVSVSGSVVVIGAYSDDDSGTYAGSAFVYRFDGQTWNEEAKLLGSDVASGDHFGSAVSIYEDTVVVGAHWHDGGEYEENSGAAYVYRFVDEAWLEEAKMVASDAYYQNKFGNAVAVHDDVILVGSLFGDGPGTDVGTAYIFRSTGDKIRNI